MSKLSTKDIVEAIKLYSLVEINDLVKLIEDEFNVSANFAVSAGSSSDAGDAKAAAPTEQDLYLTSAGTNKIAVIKIIRELTGLGLMDAKKLVDTPGLVKSAVPSAEAEDLKKKFVEAGATIEFK